jgi:hypothetical protein
MRQSCESRRRRVTSSRYLDATGSASASARGSGWLTRGLRGVELLPLGTSDKAVPLSVVRVVRPELAAPQVRGPTGRAEGRSCAPSLAVNREGANRTPPRLRPARRGLNGCGRPLPARSVDGEIPADVRR